MTGVLEVEFAHLGLAVAEEDGGHEEEGGGAGGAGFAAELEGAIEGGVADAGEDGHAAALGGEVDEARTLVDVEIEELAGGAEQGDAAGAGAREEIDQVQQGAEIGFAAARAVGRDGGGVDPLDARHAPYFTRGVRTMERNSTGP